MLGKNSKTTITTRNIPLFTDKYYAAGKRRKNPKNFNCGPLLLVLMALAAIVVIVAKSV